ncbi:MAG: flagellar basal body P-ring formation chaperone FlgA [Pseudomonadota bacterium]
MMIRPFVLVFAVLFFALTGPVAAQGTSVLLKPQANVTGSYVTLGDIFSGLTPEQEEIAVAHAPQPGRQTVLDYRWLAGIAQRHKVAWRPSTTADQILIIRDSQTIGIGEITDAVEEALVEYGIPEPFIVDLSGETFRIHIPVDNAAAITITGLDVNRRTGRFIAEVTTGDGTAQRRSYRMNGKFYPVDLIPVLVDGLQRGDVVREDQIVLRKFPSERLQAGIIRNADELIGKQVRRAVRPNEPLSARDFTSPILVKRGALVTIRLETANMSLTARGKALEDGSEGDVIRVVNLQSNKTIQVEVIADNEVRAIQAMSQ